LSQRLGDAMGGRLWCPRQESNLHLRLRRSPFYPLNYGGALGRAKPDILARPQAALALRCDATRTIAAIAIDQARALQRLRPLSENLLP
jgi:hypothetical protein